MNRSVIRSGWMPGGRWGAAALAVALLGLGGCEGSRGVEPALARGGFGNELPRQAAARGVALKPRVVASEGFRERWHDGKAELSGYEVTVQRYGQARRGHAVLIYVTEDLDARTWIKDDGGVEVPRHRKVSTLKLNHNLAFQTGIYPYHVMTSVFSPVNGIGRERFAPVKIAFSSQEWCGQVYQVLKPTADRMYRQIRSYFSAEGEQDEALQTPPFTLYEDALLIQLRELDGPFASGRDWSGFLVPTLWSTRKRHRTVRPRPATITRSETTLEGRPVHRFVLRYGAYQRTYHVERGGQQRILRWSTNRGDRARLLRTARLAYWKLNGRGDAQWRKRLGLPARLSLAGSRQRDEGTSGAAARMPSDTSR